MLNFELFSIIFKLTNVDEMNCGTSVSVKFDDMNMVDIELFNEFFNDQ